MFSSPSPHHPALAGRFERHRPTLSSRIVYSAPLLNRSYVARNITVPFGHYFLRKLFIASLSAICTSGARLPHPNEVKGATRRRGETNGNGKPVRAQAAMSPAFRQVAAVRCYIGSGRPRKSCGSSLCITHSRTDRLFTIKMNSSWVRAHDRVGSLLKQVL